ncbi:MAG: glycoside hydrolase family 140 protein [Fimbriimonadaceae bacterium]
MSRRRRLSVSAHQRYLQREDGSPFFYLGDTAWELFHRLSREEADRYLQDRAAKGFTAIQGVVLAEIDGLSTPNAEGHLPLVDRDPSQPNEPYFSLVDHVVRRCNELGMFCAMLPTWGDKWTNAWGQNNVIFDAESAHDFGRFLAMRYQDADIIWVLGGDRPIDTQEHRDVIRSMARGIRSVVGNAHLITFHPKGGRSSCDEWPDEDWLDFHMLQSGHCGVEVPNYDMVAKDYAHSPTKPCMDGEPRYEDHPIMTPEWKTTPQRFGAWDARKAAYHSLFSGAHGHTYGCHDIWQMWDHHREMINRPCRPWHEALSLPGASQMRHAKNLLLSRPYFTRVPDNRIVLDSFAGGKVIGTRDSEGSFLMVYLPEGGYVDVDQTGLTGPDVHAWWFDPRTGDALDLGAMTRDGSQGYESPNAGVGSDWILVVDDASRDFPPPGTMA